MWQASRSRVLGPAPQRPFCSTSGFVGPQNSAPQFPTPGAATLGTEQLRGSVTAVLQTAAKWMLDRRCADLWGVSSQTSAQGRAEGALATRGMFFSCQWHKPKWVVLITQAYLRPLLVAPSTSISLAKA